MFRLRTTATVSLLVLAGATGMSLWMSAWPRMHDRATEAAVAARQQAYASAKSSTAQPSRHRQQSTEHAVIHPARAAPPSPPTAVYSPSPAYPMEALRQQREGRVTLQVSVDGQGKVTAVSVVQSSGDPALDASARKTMREWRFRAPRDHQSMTFDYPVVFRIGQ